MERPPYTAAIDRLDLLDRLADFDPVTIGTPPLGIATETSDIDVACFSENLERFRTFAVREFGDIEGFAARTSVHAGMQAIVVSFQSSGWEIELFCQALRTAEQWGVRHFRIEKRLMEIEPLLGNEVLNLKRLGLKTEPAFAQILQLPGNPYEAMLDLENQTDEELRKLIFNRISEP
ncbi:DUF4269 domain-containing protein [Roseibium sp.]|uniref:DUF4269 domain-containing protein n=1 Tax=Roseibium sp. TaxID=1936156 RepID=UPI0026270182|nr:DUF4269 domain-containing protein [Roseibium sp.]